MTFLLFGPMINCKVSSESEDTDMILLDRRPLGVAYVKGQNRRSDKEEVSWAEKIELSEWWLSVSDCKIV